MSATWRRGDGGGSFSRLVAVRIGVSDTKGRRRSRARTAPRRTHTRRSRASPRRLRPVRAPCTPACRKSPATSVSDTENEEASVASASARQAKIGHDHSRFRLLIGRVHEHYVVALEVAMDDARRDGRPRAPRPSVSRAAGLGGRQPAGSMKPLGQRLAGQQLHGEKDDLVPGPDRPLADADRRRRCGRRSGVSPAARGGPRA